MSEAADLRCVFCDRSSAEVPVLSVAFRGGTFGICSQHVPVLIHDPSQLTGRLAGAEELEAADHHD